jgi:hypothetical protein
MNNPLAEVRHLPHAYEPAFKVARLVVCGVPVTPEDLNSPAGLQRVAERINRAAEAIGMAEGRKAMVA